MREAIISIRQIPQGSAAGADRFLREVRDTVRAMLRPAIIFELPANARLDSFAIDFVIRCASEAAIYDAKIALAATSEEHRLLLDVIRFSNVLPVFGSVAEAVADIERHLRPVLADRLAGFPAPTPAA